MKLWLFVSCLNSMIMELLVIGLEPLVALLVWGVTMLVCVLHLSLKHIWSNTIPHAIMANCQAWRIRSSYSSLVWWWSSPKWLPPCSRWCKLEQWCCHFLLSLWPWDLPLPSCNLMVILKVGSIRVMHVVLSTYTPSLLKLLQSPKLCFCFIGYFIFFVTSHKFAHWNMFFNTYFGGDALVSLTNF